MIDEAVNIFKEYISMENVFFIPFLIFIGTCIKKSKRIDDTLIPDILGVLGIFLCSIVAFSQNQPLTWMNWVILIVVAIGQGICVSGCAVFLNQWFKQNQKYKAMRSFDGISSIPPETTQQAVYNISNTYTCPTCHREYEEVNHGD